DGKRTTLSNGGIFVTGTLGKAGLVFEEMVTSRPRKMVAYDCVVHRNNAVPTEALALQFTLPIGPLQMKLDGKEFLLPAKYSPGVPALDETPCHMLEIPLEDGSSLRFQGKISIRVGDERRVQKDEFVYRVYFQPEQGTAKNFLWASLHCTIEHIHLNNHPIPLDKAANMGFADEVAGDGQGGWTDQGPQNDLRSFRPGLFRAGPLQFQVTDPAANGGKSVITLGRSFPRTATVQVPEKARGRFLYLLHAGAWTRPGIQANVHVTFADGSEQTKDVHYQKDIGNWHRPLGYANAGVAWTGRLEEVNIGLYVTLYYLQRDDPVSLTFEEKNPESMWMIVGATLADTSMDFELFKQEYVMKEGPDFLAIEPLREIQAGSPIDFSWNLDAPAGKYGHVVARNGHFVFEKAPEKRIKFHGTNFVGRACYPDHDKADWMAEVLARFGYNSVRFHHQDKALVKPHTSPIEFDADLLDRLDYFFAALKKRGIYVVSDFYSSREIYPEYNIPEWTPPFVREDFKVLIAFSPALEENWKEYVRLWMNHVNPYTKLSWKDDPALVMNTLINENNIYHRLRNNPYRIHFYDKLFADWAAKNYPGKDCGKPDVQNNRYFLEFLAEHQSALRKRQCAFLRDELKVKFLITDGNQNSHANNILDRVALYDVVDNHAYQDHPYFPGERFRLPMGYRQRSALTQFLKSTHLEFGMAPLNQMVTRVWGMPFTITETSYCIPNQYRSEMPALLGGIAGLQDWDGIWRFQHEASPSTVWQTRKSLTGTFNGNCDPLALLSDQVLALLFVRGDVAPSNVKVGIPVPHDFWKTGMSMEYPVAFEHLALSAQIGTSLDKNPEGVRPWKDGLKLPTDSRVQLDARALRLAIHTPRSAVIFLPEGDSTAGPLAVAKATRPQTVCLSSMDGNDLHGSRSMLLYHLPEVYGNLLRFTDDSLQMQLTPAKDGVLLRRQAPQITIKLDAGTAPTVTALRPDGSPIGIVPAQFQNGVLSFEAKNDRFPDGVMVYSITRQ
ncbi:MAG: hypothetical protein IJJ26_11075, partial [Victivallales bacterium]|nr:hypothetical protein [Victivallales bacterium]